MTSALPIGFSDFPQLRREGLHYVDKTGLAVDVVRSQRQVVLLPRPRRFGKTLNLTMLRAFFERGGEGDGLFEGLAVTASGPDVMAHFQRHAVIFLSFKDVKHASWQACLDDIARLVALEAGRQAGDLGPLRPELQTSLDGLLRRQAPLADLRAALSLLSMLLRQATGEPVVILIDEYDTPIHAGYVNGYYEEAVSFFRGFLSAGFKDNPHLYRGVITGILRVAKESIFSGLNNVDVHTVLSSQFTEHFGFLESEVEALAEQTGQPEILPTLREWYNGYQIGTRRVYNPWSVLSQLARPGSPPQPYWVNTASDEILRELLIEGGLGVHDELAALIRGESIHRPVSEDLVLQDLRRSPSALWSFLLFSGYLTADAPLSRTADGLPDTPLRVPNREVSTVYRTLFQGWLERSLSSWSDAPRRLCQALLSGDAETFEALLEGLLLTTLSHHDVGGRRPEAVYQAFIVGLLVQLEATHEVLSNREAGYGRYDVIVRPRTAGRPGAVLELKVLQTSRGETAEQALDRAIQQVRARRYGAELLSAGASPAWQWAAVFDGKRAWAVVEPVPTP